MKKKLAGVSARSLDTFATRARKAAGLEGQIQVLITSSDELQSLNRRFRHKDKPTDVLSFPAVTGTAGDIAISSEIASDNAYRLGHSLDEELRILILHGILHLVGHDHETDKGQMEALESDLRDQLKLPSSLIERTVATPKKRAKKRGKR